MKLLPQAKSEIEAITNRAGKRQIIAEKFGSATNKEMDSVLP